MLCCTTQIPPAGLRHSFSQLLGAWDTYSSQLNHSPGITLNWKKLPCAHFQGLLPLNNWSMKGIKKKKSSVILSQGETVGTSQLFCIPYRINWGLYCKCIAVQSLLLPNPVSFTPRTWCSPKHSQKTLGMQIWVYFLEILPSDTRDAIAPNHHDREETGKGTES